MNPEELKKQSTTPKKNLSHGSKDDLFIRPLRTYQDDVKNAVQKDSISTAKILMAEQQKREIEAEHTEQTSIKSKTNVAKLGVSALLIILGIGAVGGAYYYFQLNKESAPTQAIILLSDNFIDVNETVLINRTNLTNRETVGQIREEIIKNENSQKENNLKEIKLSKTVTTVGDDGKQVVQELELSTDEFLTTIEAREPDALTRSLDPKFLIGTHKTKTSVEPFIIFKTIDYETSYANLLLWERTMIGDIQDIFYRKLGSSQFFIGDVRGGTIPTEDTVPSENTTTGTDDVATTTATSSESVETENMATTTVATSTAGETTLTIPQYDPRDFKDLILSNRDTRSISSSSGELLFFYSFAGRKHIIMTTNLETFDILIQRINTAQLIR